MGAHRDCATADRQDGAIVATAVVRASTSLEIPEDVVAHVIGVGIRDISLMRTGELQLDPNSKPFQLAVLFVRLFRSLDALVGGDKSVAGAWLRNDNLALGGRPIDLIQSVSGLTNVISYLDARRAIV